MVASSLFERRCVGKINLPIKLIIKLPSGKLRTYISVLKEIMCYFGPVRSRFQESIICATDLWDERRQLGEMERARRLQWSYLRKDDRKERELGRMILRL